MLVFRIVAITDAPTVSHRWALFAVEVWAGVVLELEAADEEQAVSDRAEIAAPEMKPRARVRRWRMRAGYIAA
jgi:hypothetical protein